MMALGNTRFHLSHYMPDTGTRQGSIASTDTQYRLSSSGHSMDCQLQLRTPRGSTTAFHSNRGWLHSPKLSAWEKRVGLQIVTFSVCQ